MTELELVVNEDLAIPFDEEILRFVRQDFAAFRPIVWVMIKAAASGDIRKTSPEDTLTTIPTVIIRDTLNMIAYGYLKVSGIAEARCETLKQLLVIYPIVPPRIDDDVQAFL
jgi:hypothetical protein